MPRKLPPYVEKNHVKGHTYLSFRIRSKKGPRIRLPDDPSSEEFRIAYAAAMAGNSETKPKIKEDAPGTIGALIASYKASSQFKALSDTSKVGYASRMETIRLDHGHRAVTGLTKDRIKTFILAPLADRPGAALDTLKKLRILIKHAIDKEWLTHDASIGIKRPKGKEIRAWTDRELAAFEERWPIGTKQRTAYALMLNMGTARVDTHLLTWRQVDTDATYTRHKTGVPVEMAIAGDLRKALKATPRKHMAVITTAYGRRTRWTASAASCAMRSAPPDCHSTASRTGYARLSAASWPTRNARRTRLWPRSVTPRWPRPRDTREKPIVGAGESAPW